MYDVSYRLNAPTCIAEAVDDDLIVINLVNGKYYNMRGSSALAWEALLEGCTPNQLLRANQWTDAETQAFGAFVQLLVDESLMVEHGPAGESASSVSIVLSEDPAPFQMDVFTDMEEMLRLDPVHEVDANVGWPHKPD